MELLQLRYFIDSAKTENFSVVANKYFVPASSVSSSVRKLEKELGCHLFDRTANKLCLNENGRAFFDNIHTALSLIDSGVEKLSSAKTSLGHMNILVKSKKRVIRNRLIEFIKNNPSFTFKLTQSNVSENTNDYDIIVDDRHITYKNFLQKPIAKEKIRIAAAKSNPLCKRQLILNDLKHSSFISTSEGTFLNTITKKICNNAGFNPNIIIETESSADMVRYIKEDFGISFLSHNFLSKAEKRDIDFLNVTDLDYSRITYIYLNENKHLSKAAKLFYDYIKAV